MRTEFIEKLYSDAKVYPYGRPKEEKKKWEDMSAEEQADWNEFANSRVGKIYAMACEVFNLKQQHGLSEEMAEIYLGLEDDDLKLFRSVLQHCKEGHAVRSRKGFEEKFRTT